MTAVFFHPEADAELIAAAVYYEGQQEELGKRSGPSFILSTWKPGPIFPLAPYSPVRLVRLTKYNDFSPNIRGLP